VNSSISKPSADWPTHWPSDSFRAGPTLLFVLAVAIASGIILTIGLVITRNQILATGTVPVVSAIGIQFVLEAIIVAMILFALPRLAQLPLAQLGFKPIGWREIVTGVLGAIAMIVIVQGSASIIDTLLHQQHEQEVVELFRQLRAPATIWFFAFFAAVIAPIAEETIFRVFLFNLGRRYGGLWVGAVVSSIAFGAVHGDPYAFVPLALGGMLLCYLYYRTRNAFTSMIAHGLFNAVTLLALVFTPNLAH
jgi:membrane protease YdiL (CAAX protease family)